MCMCMYICFALEECHQCACCLISFFFLGHINEFLLLEEIRSNGGSAPQQYGGGNFGDTLWGGYKHNLDLVSYFIACCIAQGVA